MKNCFSCYRCVQPLEVCDMTCINSINFRGSGSESTGSIAHNNNPTECPTCGTNCGNACEGKVSFRGSNDYDYYENSQKKKTSTLGVVATLAGITIAGIAGLGYAHKTNALNKLKDGKVKNLLAKLEPAGEKCHEWCSTVKTKSSELIDKVKNLFSSKKS